MQQNNIEENIQTSKSSNNRRFATLIYTFAGIIILSGIIGYTNYWQKNLEIKEIKIVGNKYIPKVEIQNLVYRYILANKLSSVNFNFVKEKILQNQFIRNVHFITTYPGEIVISLDVKNILAIGKSENKDDYLITEDGEVIAKKNYSFGFSLPRVDFSKFSKVNYSQEIKDIAAFLKTYYVDKSEKIKANSIWKSSEGICFSVLNGIIVKIGNLNDLHFKFHKFEEYMKTLLNANESYPNYIDLRWSNQVVVNY